MKGAKKHSLTWHFPGVIMKCAAKPPGLIPIDKGGGIPDT
jgi:hypothetical protein